MPTITELLASYRDRTGHSYREMSGKVRNEIHWNRLQQLGTAPPKAFPEARTIELLSELLEVPTATIVLAFAAGLGIPIRHGGTMLERTLPPGSDSLTPEDREAVRVVTRALIDARRGEGGKVVDLARPPLPDFSRVAARHGYSEGQRLREEQDNSEA